MRSTSIKPLRGASVAITRPVGAGIALRARIRTLGGLTFSLPGSSLRTVEDARAARAALREALACDAVIFTSPAAVRFASSLRSLRTPAVVLAPGSATARALRSAGVNHVIVPSRSDSEGMLALPILQRVRGKRIGMIGAAGGRGLLQRELARSGAHVIEAQVYRRVPARLDARHVQPLLRQRGVLYVPLSSSEALRNLLGTLPDKPRQALLAGTTIASSERLLHAARDAGFASVLRAASASDDDLIAAILAAHASIRP